MSSYLVTGGAGFIGSHIVDKLVNMGQRVRVIDNFSTGKKENLSQSINKIDFIEGDIRSKKDLLKALRGIDFVLHQAALRSVPKSVDDPISTNDVNISGTLLLLKVARESKVRRVVYAASSSAYGDSKLLPKKENQLPAPISPYAVSKLTGEYYCRVYSKIFGLETVSLRYFNVFGPRQDPLSKYAAVVPKFICNALEDKPLEIHGDGKQSRDFTYIDNVVSANILAAKARGVSGEVFNIACGDNYSLIDIVRSIEKILKKKVKCVHVIPRLGDARHTLADISKAKKNLGFKVLVNFKKGMENTINHLRNNK